MLQFLYTTKIKPVEVNVNFLYHLETSENHRYFVFSAYRREHWPEMSHTTTISARAAQFDVASLKR